MSFASYTYFGFIALCFALHWLLPERVRKPFLVAASYVFYGSWNWQLCFLLLAVSVFAWGYGLLLARREGAGHWLLAGILVELAPLLYFKYSGFILQNVVAVGQLLGRDWPLAIPHVLLPLGISFFTFQGIAYLVDVAAGETPFRSLLDFLLYKGFWPQLIAGPIIRPGEIHDQIATSRSLRAEDLGEGGKRILFGLFKKMVLADMVAEYVDAAFVPSAHPGMVDAVAGILGFSLQIYWDFAGYSDIAIGSARLFGFKFPENFDFPYLSRSPQEFWSRWHMSLSRWIRDYVFTPISFAFRGSRGMALGALVFAMAVCGLWHGAAWTFVAWGVWHGVALALNQSVLRRLFGHLEPGSPARSRLRGLCGWLLTLAAVDFGWLLFRARDFGQVREMLSALLSLRGGLRPMVLRENGVLIIALLFASLLLVQALRPQVARLIARLDDRPRLARPVRGVIYAIVILAVVVFDKEAKTFVYFQF